MSDLTKKKCVPCEGGTQPLSHEETEKYLRLVEGWATDGNGAITKEFKFKDFVEAVVFITDIAHVAEEEDHHPDINLHSYKFVLVSLKTHAINGLSENDFILAAKINQIQRDGTT